MPASRPRDCILGTPVHFQEVEHDSINGRMRVIDKSGANGGRVLAALSNGTARYCQRAVSAGRYRLRETPTGGNSVLSTDDVRISDASTGGAVTKVPPPWRRLT